MVFAHAGFDYKTVFWEMTPLEIEEANIALGIREKAIKQKNKRRGGNGYGQ